MLSRGSLLCSLKLLMCLLKLECDCLQLILQGGLAGLLLNYCRRQIGHGSRLPNLRQKRHAQEVGVLLAFAQRVCALVQWQGRQVIKPEDRARFETEQEYDPCQCPSPLLLVRQQ